MPISMAFTWTSLTLLSTLNNFFPGWLVWEEHVFGHQKSRRKSDQQSYDQVGFGEFAEHRVLGMLAHGCRFKAKIQNLLKLA